MARKERVVVAMSGGVDSSVAAALLKQAGYEVIGITLCFNLPDRQGKRPGCCGWQGIEDARRVAQKIGIKHYVLNMQKILEAKVIKDFCQQYMQGRTPNPCVRCNQYIKFGALLKKARALGARYLATGHYARISQKYLLKKGKDKRKDQSYFLYRLGQRQLKQILFPLGDYTKDEVRKMAQKFGLSVASKPGSQEICFLPDNDYRQFLLRRLPKAISPGLIVNRQGEALGKHKGIAFYTVGQREGLGVALGYPAYITGINGRQNRIVLGRREDAEKKDFLLKKPHFMLKALKKKVAWQVKIRYNHKEALAKITPLGRKLKVSFLKPQFAITPGQSAVFYDKDTVIGGGIIERVLD